MRIAVASDHAGFRLKEEIKETLAEHEVSDFGTYDEVACDLPDFVYPAALAVSEGRADRGVFVDGVGYGSAMIANKVHGVFAAVCRTRSARRWPGHIPTRTSCAWARRSSARVLPSRPCGRG